MPNIETMLTQTPWLLSLLIAVFLGGEIQRQLARRRWKGRSRSEPHGRRVALVSSQPTQQRFDPAQQLREVELATFERRRIMNSKEYRLFLVVEVIVAEHFPGCRVMAQVSLGEILASPRDEAFRAINSKRVDLLIIDKAGYPLQAIEFQGDGHYLGPAATRDAVKKEALRKAGVGLVEVMAGDKPEDVRRALTKSSKPPVPA